MEIKALRFKDSLPEEYQEIHTEAFCRRMNFFPEETYLLHPNSGNPIYSLVVEARTPDKQLIGFFIIVLQDLFGNIWSICKTKKYPVNRFFEKTFTYFLTHIVPVQYTIMLVSKEIAYEMTEQDRLFYYSSIGFKLTVGSEIQDLSGNIYKNEKCIDVSGIDLKYISGVSELRMLALRDDVLRLR